MKRVAGVGGGEGQRTTGGGVRAAAPQPALHAAAPRAAAAAHPRRPHPPSKRDRGVAVGVGGGPAGAAANAAHRRRAGGGGAGGTERHSRVCRAAPRAAPRAGTNLHTIGAVPAPTPLSRAVRPRPREGERRGGRQEGGGGRKGEKKRGGSEGGGSGREGNNGVAQGRGGEAQLARRVHRPALPAATAAHAMHISPPMASGGGADAATQKPWEGKGGRREGAILAGVGDADSEGGRGKRRSRGGAEERGERRSPPLPQPTP